MKKVCIVTAARSEYGLLRWVIDEVHKSSDLELQLVVTGAHLLEDQGYTFKFIENDGYPISAKVDMHLNSTTKKDIVKSTGYCSIGFADTLSDLNPNIVLVLGDRYELLPICSAALLMNIPIAHIAGGEITEGAIDNEVRNVVTMMASIHFPNGIEAYEAIIKMRGNCHDVYKVGEPCIENYRRLQLKDRSKIAEEYGWDLNKDWYLVTLHPETNLTLQENLNMINCMINVLLDTKNSEIIITGSNADFGGSQFNSIYKDKEKECSNIHFYNSLGQINYLSCLREAFCVIGNSSSGVIETPYLGIPTVNIGNRQTGRRISANIRCSGYSETSISHALKEVTSQTRYEPDYSFGDGYTSSHILQHIINYLYERK